MSTRELAYNIPNEETLESFKELDNNGGFTFNGTTEHLFNKLAEDSINEREHLAVDPKNNSAFCRGRY